MTTDVVVMTAKVEPPGGSRGGDELELDTYDRRLMTAVVDRAERLGKKVIPLIVPTNNPLNAVLITAKDIGAQELMLGASNKYTAEEQLDQLALYWINLNGGQPNGLTVHLVSNDRDVTFDLDGGNRIPKAAQRQARSVAELRAAGIGVRRVLLAHDGTSASRDVFEWLLTMLAPEVALNIIGVHPLDPHAAVTNGDGIEEDRKHAAQLDREVTVLEQKYPSSAELVRLAREGNYNVIVLPWSEESRELSGESEQWVHDLLQTAPCSVFLAAHPVIPREVSEV